MEINLMKLPFSTMSLPTLVKPAMSFIAWIWETSGLVLFAKNPFILPILNRLLEKKEIAREYWALVKGQVGEQRTYLPR